MNRSELLVAALTLAAASIGLAQSVTLELKNGDRVTGRILSETNNFLVLSNAWTAHLDIPTAQIAKRFAPTNVVLTVKDNGVATNVVASNAVAFAKAVASTNTPFTSPILKNWHGDLQVGTDLSFSERNRQVYNAKAKLNYTKFKFKSVMDFDTTYGRSEVEQTIADPRAPGGTRTERRTVTDANRMLGSVKMEYDIPKEYYLYHLGGAGYDEIRKIDVHYELGPGLGYHLIARSNFLANAEIGFNFQDEEHTEGASISTFYFRFAQNMAWKISPHLTWDEKFEYMPRIDDVGEYRLRLETNLRYAMLQNIFLNLSVVDIYDSEPATGVTQNDLQVRSSVGVKF